MPPSQRLPHIDLLKAFAAQMVLLHHLSAYGPIAAAFAEEFPVLSAWFFNQARAVVQIFLVAGGFLVARSLLAPGKALPPLGPTLAKRYLRLALPYAAALLLAALGAAYARPWIQDDFVPGAPGLAQALAHLLLLQGILGYESLSSGVWYVAIDFQLFALAFCLVKLSHWTSRPPTLALLLVGGFTAASLFYFNRHSDWDNFAIYFFGAYGLGLLTYRISFSERPWPWICLIFALVALALILDFRERIALALLTALLLFVAARPWARPVLALLDSGWISYLGKTSYSLFLTHFSLILVGNALFSQFAPQHPLKGTLGLLAIWGASMLLARPFHHWVEERAGRLRLG